MGPFDALASRQVEGVCGDGFKRFVIAALGINFKQLGMDGHALRVHANCLFENLFCLQVAPIGQIHISLGHRVYIPGRIQLAGRINHG